MLKAYRATGPGATGCPPDYSSPFRRPWRRRAASRRSRREFPQARRLVGARCALVLQSPGSRHRLSARARFAAPRPPFPKGPMAKTVLIIEDDEATGKLLTTLCAKLEVETDVVRNGKDGYERAHGEAPDLLILDLLVPGMDGFKVAEGLKAAKALPKLIVVSGVYKDPKIAKDFSDKYGAEFFQKPFRNDEVQAAIGRLLGLAVPEKPAAPAARQSAEVPAVQVGPMQGALAEKPFASIVMELFRAKASGTLDLTQGQVRKRIYFNRGQVR
ncbi:MAG TPA: hypothetical protein DFS52_27955, partial [Myxococcales bacterium]|nr:hypothetical protein [Myxococcales bacterium]